MPACAPQSESSLQSHFPLLPLTPTATSASGLPARSGDPCACRRALCPHAPPDGLCPVCAPDGALCPACAPDGGLPPRARRRSPCSRSCRLVAYAPRTPSGLCPACAPPRPMAAHAPPGGPCPARPWATRPPACAPLRPMLARMPPGGMCPARPPVASRLDPMPPARAAATRPRALLPATYAPRAH